MNPDIESLLLSFTNNSLPSLWRSRSYPSKKPLLSFVKDLRDRLSMLTDWIEQGQPIVFWLSGFFFTQSFLTGVKQNFARKYRYPIDKVTFSFKVLKYETMIKEAPANGCIARGLFLEGASWNNEEGVLQEAEAKILYSEMPAIHFIPEIEVEIGGGE